MKFADTDFEPFVLTLPAIDAIPLVCDSPHSGVIYPADFKSRLPISVLRCGEDTYVDELWRAIPHAGGTLLTANFPRTYIDLNRDIDDIDPEMLLEPWTTELNPTEKSRLGHGLIWSIVSNQAIYDHKLEVADIENRIGSFYEPYHAALNQQVEAAYARFGGIWHLNLHSMPSDSYKEQGIDTDRPLADFVLGDRDGTTCDVALVDMIDDFLTGRGHTVARNDPYKGVALIAHVGRPDENRHSVQIEINRPLYMNEQTFEKTANFAALQHTLTLLTARVAEFVRDRIGSASP